MDVIQVEHLSKQYRDFTALRDLNFSIKEKEIFGFLGPSGAGKTTTIKILTGQLKPTSGAATVLGQPTEAIDEHLYERIGIVTDNSGIYEKLSVYQNILVFAQLLNVSRTRVDQLLKKVGLYQYRKRPAGKLSTGMRQRLILVRAILHSPQVLFLDEPTSGLDPTTMLAVHDLLREVRDSGTAIFLTTHNMAEATELCDRVALLNSGEIVECASPKTLQLKYTKQQQYRILLSDRTEVTLPDSPATTVQINQWLQRHEVLTIHSCEPDLAEVFIEVTGRKLA